MQLPNGINCAQVAVGSVLLSANGINVDPLTRPELLAQLQRRPLQLRFRKPRRGGEKPKFQGQKTVEICGISTKIID